MKELSEKNKRILLGATSGAVGGALGAVSGSNSWVVVAIVSASLAALTAWGISGLFDKKK